MNGIVAGERYAEPDLLRTSLAYIPTWMPFLPRPKMAWLVRSHAGFGLVLPKGARHGAMGAAQRQGRSQGLMPTRNFVQKMGAMAAASFHRILCLAFWPFFGAGAATSADQDRKLHSIAASMACGQAFLWASAWACPGFFQNP
jgi:hypothetical protein